MLHRNTVLSLMTCKHATKGDTLARWVCRLFLASAVSEIRLEKSMLTLLNWFHISLDVVFSRISISSLSLWEEARWLWECRMLSSVNFDHESGRESLSGNIVDLANMAVGKPNKAADSPISGH